MVPLSESVIVVRPVAGVPGIADRASIIELFVNRTVHSVILESCDLAFAIGGLDQISMTIVVETFTIAQGIGPR
jgi:hypothetical protein